ncbi:hypothetical protein ETAA8_68360 [Anatilimnocola aggregata]|uniref:Uncharacterized protein n=1 Tax=Anatilimnocola aggregata TaxID=2528021 RepID=A0A517YN65_9BACT|nr:hypothetical protein [Anatilimnocola aggregata]QDU31676.1 hypothetical protein ETAA8_68360 [Anatilimnocola aggregata]
MTDKRKPPVHIPLDFETAVGGLLKVDPKKLPESAKKKPTAKPATNKSAKKSSPERAAKK